jgi:RNA polymerase sigma-70 factor (ECF subfamily)
LLSWTIVAVATEQLRHQFDQLQDELREFIDRRLPKQLWPALTTEDLLQEVWLSANDSLNTVRDPQAVASWLRRIAERKVIDALRCLQTAKRGGGQAVRRLDGEPGRSYLGLLRCIAAEQRTPSSVDAAREAVVAVQRALRELPEDYRRAVTLYHIDGLSRDEVAQAMNRSTAGVNTLIYRGLALLRDVLGSPERYFSNP